VSVNSKTHDHEWAVVGTVGQRRHTSGGTFFLVPQVQDQNLIHSVIHGNTMKVYRGRRGTAQPIFNLSTKWVCLVILTPVPIYPQAKTLVPIEKEAAWALLQVWMFWRREYWVYGINKSSEVAAIPPLIWRCPV